MIWQRSVRQERGAALAIGLIMLVLISVLLVTAFRLATVNFWSVTNHQFRNEAIAATNVAIQQVIGTPFTANPTQSLIEVDIDNDSVPDYRVMVDPPECIEVRPANSADPSSLSLPIEMTVASTWNTVWDVRASVDSAENPGMASVAVRAGVRVLLSEGELNAQCP